MVALAGLLLLMAPPTGGPSLGGALAAAVAGGSWGAYSLRGRGVAYPMAATTRDCIRCVPLIALIAPLVLGRPELSTDGVILALVSGAVSTSLGSVLWYAAVRRVRVTSAASIQLVVPVLAYLGGLLPLSERSTLATVVAALVVLAGVGLCVGRAGEPAADSIRVTQRSRG